MAVYLVCEGFRQQLDERVLNALVIQFHNLGVLTAPAGGGSGVNAVRAYLQDRSPQDVAIAIEDRDYRPQAITQPMWGNPAGNRFIWRRHEIENYLLQPRVVLELFDDFRAGSAAAWVTQLPASEPDVAALLQTLAHPLLEEHTAQVLKDELVRQINGIGSLSFGPPPPIPPAGTPTRGQGQWLPALQQEAMRLSQICNAVAAMPDLQHAAIAARYQALLAQFQNPAFLSSGGYLIDMGGHELLAALSRHLHALGAPGSLTKQSVLGNELLRILEQIYQPNAIFVPDDFAELAAILSQY